MTLSTVEKQALELLATEVETASTWHSGAREQTLLGLADKLRNLPTIANALAEEAKAREEAAAAAQEAADAAAAAAEAQDKGSSKK